MKLHTTFRIGGGARIFAKPKTAEELCSIIDFCNNNGLRFLVIGNGSNLLVSDEGIDAVVIRLGNGFDYVRKIDDETIEAGAGASLATVCKFALSNELTGLEFAYGIPGTVGGAVYMNAGAYGGEMKNVVLSCTHVTPDGTLGSMEAEKMNFGYRKSAYVENGFTITSVRLKLKKGNSDDISREMNELLGKRKDKQPLEYPSAGSVFKRPEGYFAGALIEQSGLKGKRVGGAMVSEKHAGFIVNAGDATCADVQALIALCQETVKAKFGVDLETEIKAVK